MAFYNCPLVKLCHSTLGWMTQVSSGSIRLSDLEQSEIINLNICMWSILQLTEIKFSSLNSTSYYSIANIQQANTGTDS